MNKKEAIGWIVFVVGVVIFSFGIDVTNWICYLFGIFVFFFGLEMLHDSKREPVKINVRNIKTQEDYDKACKLLQEAGFNEKM